VVVDQHAVADRVPRQMDLAHRGGRHAVDEGARIDAEIARAHVHVVHVEQQAAAGPFDDRGQEFPLGEMRVLERHVGGHVLDEQARPEEVLRLAHLRGQVLDGFVGEGQRQQVVEMFAAGVAPAGVFGHQRGLEAADRAAHALQVIAVEAVGGAEAEPDAVQAQRVVSSRALPRAHRRAAIVVVGLGVRFDPHYRWTRGDGVVVNGPEADPGASRNRPQRHTSGFEA
jgi:hypothetical protein